MPTFVNSCIEKDNPRSVAIKAVAKANKLELEFVKTIPWEGTPTEYLKINPLGRIPSFEGADGYVLTECIAIAIYSRLLVIWVDNPRNTSAMMRTVIIYSYPCLNTLVEKTFTLTHFKH